MDKKLSNSPTWRQFSMLFNNLAYISKGTILATVRSACYAHDQEHNTRMLSIEGARIPLTNVNQARFRPCGQLSLLMVLALALKGSRRILPLSSF